MWEGSFNRGTTVTGELECSHDMVGTRKCYLCIYYPDKIVYADQINSLLVWEPDPSRENYAHAVVASTNACNFLVAPRLMPCMHCSLHVSFPNNLSIVLKSKFESVLYAIIMANNSCTHIINPWHDPTIFHAKLCSQRRRGSVVYSTQETATSILED